MAYKEVMSVCLLVGHLVSLPRAKSTSSEARYGFFYAFYEAINGLPAHHKSLMTFCKQVACKLNKLLE
jgi:hypothetical protein